MKAKELAEILLQNPDADVVFPEYDGDEEVLTPVNSTELAPKGQIRGDVLPGMGQTVGKYTFSLYNDLIIIRS